MYLKLTSQRMNRVMHQNLWGGDFHFCPLRMTYHRNCFPVAKNNY